MISHATVYNKPEGCGEKGGMWNVLLISVGALYFFTGIRRLTEILIHKLLVKNCRAADSC